ncbi:7011_t:CDS:2 [Cetraspora pellucida]|uniref:7011_t:CDS:1 n=1 Tax=Cetraspora pellucida TaxID=1433469 RepID=A0A9N9A5M0_9GLOM|nr:7011_t:CDS:2 [Cetraspora pellucida]
MNVAFKGQVVHLVLGGAPRDCADGQTCCNKKCIDTDSDPKNCGSCNNACAVGQTCCSGKCIDTNTDAAHCGSCNNTCIVGQTCQTGKCGSPGCTADSQCLSGQLHNATAVLPAQGKCISSVCYLCLSSCVGKPVCNSIIETEGAKPVKKDELGVRNIHANEIILVSI